MEAYVSDPVDGNVETRGQKLGRMRRELAARYVRDEMFPSLQPLPGSFFPRFLAMPLCEDRYSSKGGA